MPVIRLARMNQCSAAAEEAARVALASGVFREGLTLKVSGAGRSEASAGHQQSP